jgi:transcriptional regulator NrdR family protein
MNCPECGTKAQVKDTRPNHKNREVYRRHVCPECDHEFFTIETDIENDEYFRKTWLKYDRTRMRELEAYNK